MVRRATAQDLDALVRMGLEFGRASEYSGTLRVSEAACRATAALFVGDDPDKLALVAEKDGSPVGMLLMFIYQHPLSGERSASELAWWVAKPHRGRIGVELWRAAERWATARGVSVIQMIAPNETVEHMYEACGYVAVERQYQRRVA